MNESDFHRLADATLVRLRDALEEADVQGVLDVELLDGVLTIICPQKKTLVVSKHAPSRQVWLSSPLSGGLHFPYDAAGHAWALDDGTTMEALLRQDVRQLAMVTMG